jgi:hypothetical protein
MFRCFIGLIALYIVFVLISGSAFMEVIRESIGITPRE